MASISMGLNNDSRNRRTAGYWAFLGHRLSGLALAAFLPLHFLALGSALSGEDALQKVIGWTDMPLVKLAELGLVFSLALHLGLGLRILYIENAASMKKHKFFAGLSLVFALAATLVFLLSLSVL
ncbi:MAG: succinate dehydrogenase, cytochrome b556 subunit [Burkholderiaceae bacterium]